MEIKVDKRGPKEYYEEYYFVLSRYKQLIKKPNSKAYQFTKYLISYFVFGVFGLLLDVFFYLTFKNNLFIFCGGMFALILVYDLYVYYNGKKVINTLMNDNKTKYIDINNDYVSYKDDLNEYKVEWKDIKYIIVNKYSIVFLPVDISKLVISISSEYLDQVKQGISEANQLAKLVDNTK